MSTLDNAKNVTSVQFAKLPADQRAALMAEAVKNGRALALVCDQAASPQERAAGSVALVTMGGQKLPAQIAAIAGRNSCPQRVAAFVTDYAAGIRLVDTVDAAKARDYTGNARKAANRWAAEHHKGFVLTSDKGAGASRYHWVAEAEAAPAGSVESAPADVAKANQEKADAAKARDIGKAEQKGLKAGLAQAEAMAAESTATMAAELAAIRAELAEARAGEARALHLARHYAEAAGATGSQKVQLTKAAKAAAAKAKAAAKAIGKVFTLPALPGKAKAKAKAA